MALVRLLNNCAMFNLQSPYLMMLETEIGWRKNGLRTLYSLDLPSAGRSCIASVKEAHVESTVWLLYTTSYRYHTQIALSLSLSLIGACRRCLKRMPALNKLVGFGIIS